MENKKGLISESILEKWLQEVVNSEDKFLVLPVPQKVYDMVSKYFKRRADNYDVAWLNYPLFFRANPFKKSLITVVSTAYGKVIHKMYPLPLHLYYNISFQIEK